MTTANGATGYLISEGDALTNPVAELAGAFFEAEIPATSAGPARPARVLLEEMAAYLRSQGLLSAYNAMPSTRKCVEFRTIAEKMAFTGAPADASTMEELDPASMCLGTEIYVSNDPDAVHEYKVVYGGPLLVWVDGNFGLGSRGRIQAQVVPNPGGGTPTGYTYTNAADVPAAKRIQVVNDIAASVSGNGLAMVQETDTSYLGKYFKDPRAASGPCRYTCDQEANPTTGATECWWNRTRIQ